MFELGNRAIFQLGNTELQVMFEVENAKIQVIYQ